MSQHREMFNVAAAYTSLSIGTGSQNDVHYTGASDPDIHNALNISPTESNPALNNLMKLQV